MDKDNVGADGVQSGSNGDLSMTSGPSLAGPVNSTTDGAAELEIPHGRSGSSVEPSPASRSAVQLNSQVANQPDSFVTQPGVMNSVPEVGPVPSIAVPMGSHANENDAPSTSPVTSVLPQTSVPESVVGATLRPQLDNQLNVTQPLPQRFAGPFATQDDFSSLDPRMQLQNGGNFSQMPQALGRNAPLPNTVQMFGSASTETQDAALLSEKAKRKSFPLIVALGVFLLVLGIGLFVFLAMRGENEQNIDSNGSFMIYANYIINGTEVPNDLEDYDIFMTQESALNKAVNQRTGDVIDVDHAIELFNNFKQMYVTDDEISKSMIENYYNNLVFLNSILDDGGVYADAYIEKYAGLEVGAINDEIDATYDKYVSMNANLASDYAVLRRELDESIYDWLVMYDTNECFDQSKRFDVQACPAVESEEFSRIITNILELRPVVWELEESLVSDIWSIKIAIEGESYEE